MASHQHCPSFFFLHDDEIALSLLSPWRLMFTVNSVAVASFAYVSTTGIRGGDHSMSSPKIVYIKYHTPSDLAHTPGERNN